jgi:AAA domain, putative AbiEii toxin, Type IV TA system/Protein of unknown function (DUF2813)
MKLRHLHIERFRGIRKLDWLLAGDFICLMGPGDVGKSTILDAIELVLTSRWNPNFDDSDFYDGDTTQPFAIQATIGDLPRRLLSDAFFGLRLRGLALNGTLNDEPQDGDEDVITVCLSVDSSLEPTWQVITDRHPEGMHISAKERERMGLVRLGAVVERDLTWSRGSVLSRLTGDADEHAHILADAGRNARGTIDKTKIPKLAAASVLARELSSAFGVLPRGEFEPRLDAGNTIVAQGGLALHDGQIPLRRFGLGTRRLVALAIQRKVACEGGVILVDEVEHGLEPFRVRRLLTELLTPSVPRVSPTGSSAAVAQTPVGVVLMTTHSSVVVSELSWQHLRVVRTADGTMQVLTPSEAIQPLFRTNPEAFLSRRVIVCEGKTEIGLLRGIDDHWAQSGEPFAARGVALADGGGCSNVGNVALGFANLGYDTALVADSDQPLDVNSTVLDAAGVCQVVWDGVVSVEQRVFGDLPWAGIEQALAIAVQEYGADSIRAQVASALKTGSKNPADLPGSVAAWSTVRPEPEMREAIGKAAKSKDRPWFKRVDLASQLGRVVASHLPTIPGSDLAKKIGALRIWIFND